MARHIPSANVCTYSAPIYLLFASIKRPVCTTESAPDTSLWLDVSVNMMHCCGWKANQNFCNCLTFVFFHRLCIIHLKQKPCPHYVLVCSTSTRPRWIHTKNSISSRYRAGRASTQRKCLRVCVYGLAPLGKYMHIAYTVHLIWWVCSLNYLVMLICTNACHKNRIWGGVGRSLVRVNFACNTLFSRVCNIRVDIYYCICCILKLCTMWWTRF